MPGFGSRLMGSGQAFSPVYRLNDVTRPLTDAVIVDHLNGGEVIGVYPLLANNTTHFLAIDFDGDGWLEAARRVVETAARGQVLSYLERSRSGNGGHVWFFFDQPVPAAKARLLGKKLLEQSGADQRSFDRMFPSQDAHTGKGFGNLIVLPLHGRYLEAENTAFIDTDGEVIADQWAYLNAIKRVAAAAIEQFLQGSESPTDHQDTSSDAADDIVVPTAVTSQVSVTVSGRLFIPFTTLPAALLTFLKKRLIFLNPEYRKRERLGYSTWDTPRVLKQIESDERGIWLPAGILSELTSFCHDHQLELEVIDERVEGKRISATTSIQLRPVQRAIAKSLAAHERAVLVAPPGFGKTVVVIDQIRRRKRTTLVIVHTRPLLEQWQKQLRDHLQLSKHELGTIGASRWKVGSNVTIALYQTLARRGVDSIKDSFGFVIVDECHHVPAYTFTKVLRELPAKAVLGLTATLVRHDQLDRLISLYVGKPVEARPEMPKQTVTSVDSAQSAADVVVPTTAIVRRTTFTFSRRPVQFADIIDQLIIDAARNELIVKDVSAAILRGSKCLILTERVAHGELLLELIRTRCRGLHAKVLSSVATKGERRRTVQRLSHKRFQLLIATGKLIGEGLIDRKSPTYFSCHRYRGRGNSRNTGGSNGCTLTNKQRLSTTMLMLRCRC